MALVLVLLLAVLVPARTGASARADTDACPTATPAPYRVTVVGDSYTDVEPYNDAAGEGWAHLLARRMHWDLVPRAVGGSGYASAGLAGQPWTQLAPAVLADDPDLVLLVGSRNDTTVSPQSVLDAAREMHTALEELPPDVPVVVVGPIWNARPPNQLVHVVRDQVARSAAEHSLPFVDALDDGGWFRDRHDLFDPGELLHPLPGGQRLLADRIERALHELQVTPRGRAPLASPGTPRTVRFATC